MGSGEDLARLGDVMLQEVFVQGVSDLQSTDECERRDFFIIIRDFAKLGLKEVDVGFGTVSLPHLDGDKVMAILLGLLARGVLSKKYFGYLRKLVEEVWQQRVELI